MWLQSGLVRSGKQPRPSHVTCEQKCVPFQARLLCACALPARRLCRHMESESSVQDVRALLPRRQLCWRVRMSCAKGPMLSARHATRRVEGTHLLFRRCRREVHDLGRRLGVSVRRGVSSSFDDAVVSNTPFASPHTIVRLGSLGSLRGRLRCRCGLGRLGRLGGRLGGRLARLLGGLLACGGEVQHREQDQHQRRCHRQRHRLDLRQKRVHGDAFTGGEERDIFRPVFGFSRPRSLNAMALPMRIRSCTRATNAC
jgi:hypothetical protein